MASIALADPNITRLFTMDWGEVDELVLRMLDENENAGSFEGSMPHWPAAIASCQAWKGETLPAMVGFANAVAGLATTMIQHLSDLEAIVPPDPRAQLPASAEATILEQFKAMSTATANVAAGQPAVIAPLMAFADALTGLDAEWEAHGSMSLAEDPFVPVVTALRIAEGAWSALCQDFARVADQTIPITTEFLLSLEIDAAVQEWKTVGQEAADFARHRPVADPA